MLAAKGPYKPTDENRVLHQRLAIHNRHFIPIGFYYSKWLEKLRFHLDSRGEEESGSSSENNSVSSFSSKRSQETKAKDKVFSKHQRSPKRPKVNVDKGTPSNKPPSPERHTHGDERLSHGDRMRKQRAEQFTSVQELLKEENNNNNNNGHGSAEQECR
jgi:hypothetical protein